MPKQKDSLFSRIFQRAMNLKKKKIKKPKIKLNPSHPTSKAILDRKKKLDAIMKQ